MGAIDAPRSNGGSAVEQVVCRQQLRVRSIAVRAALALVAATLLILLAAASQARAVAPIVDPLVEPAADLALMPAVYDQYCGGAGEWWGPADGCKYAKAKVDTTCVNNCRSVDINLIKWRGGTASGSCDPTNDITQWRLRWIKVVRTTDNAVRWSRGAGSWYTNCNVDSATYSALPGLRVGVDHVVKYKWEHVTRCCGSFYPRVDLLVAAR
jgi:hypothetical protein